MGNCGIYCITNKINNKKYIGQSKNIPRRWREHQLSTEYNQYSIQHAIHKYGIENFNFEIIEECLPEQLNERENYWINYYNTYYDGYNQTFGGDTTPHIDYKKIIDLWNDNHSCKEIQTIMNCGDAAVTSALRAYNISDKDIKARFNTNPSKPVVALDIETNTPLKSFTSGRQAELFLNNGGLLRGIAESIAKHWSFQGYKWEYLNKYNQPKKELSDDEFFSYQKKRNYTVCEETRLRRSLEERRVERPDRDLFKAMIRKIPFTTIGKQFNVSDNAIRKWCDAYHLPRNKKDIKKYSDEEWALI